MKILGIHAGGHDTAAALLVDGHLACAISEERLDREKHSSAFPWKSIDACLAFAGLKINEIDCIAFGWNYERLIRELYLEPSLKDIRAFEYLIRDNNKLSGFLRFGDNLRDRLQYKNQIRYYNHHSCHIAYSFRTSGFNEANVISLDGAGERETGVLGHHSGEEFKEVVVYDFPNSLGLAYAALTYYLGFKHHCDEGIIMGLASYGKPQATIPGKNRTYIDVFREILPADNKGNYQVNYDWLVLGLMKGKWVTQKFKDLFGPVREPDSKLTQHHMDIAAALQLRLEEIVISMAKHLHDVHPCPNLALTGGVALNCVMNSRIESLGLYKNIYIPPAPADNGVAVGACLECYKEMVPAKANNITFTQGMIGFGPSYSKDRCRNALRAAGLSAQEPSNLVELVAELLKQGKIIGWFEGRSEFGPRALGHRSILTRPYPAEMKDILNSRVKFREYFRPFAPVIPEERANEYFQIHHASPYMMHAVPVQPKKAQEIAATVHVDGTCRMQTVNKNDLPRFYALLLAFEKTAGMPVILNTSFNIKGQPIVETPEEALLSFQGTNIDVLVLEDFVIEK